MKNLLQNFIYSAIILFGVIFVLSYKPAFSNTPKGLVLPVSDFHPAIDIDEVTIREAEKDPSAKTIGRINLELNGIVPASKAEALLMNHARQLAANIGANILYLQQVGHIEENQFGFSIYYFRADALHH